MTYADVSLFAVRPYSRYLLVLALVSGSLGTLACQRSLSPVPTLALAGKPDDRVSIDEFGANLRLNAALDARAVRRPDPAATTAHQIEAMASHVEQRSRGVDRERLRAELALVAKRHAGPGDETAWLEEAALLLLGYSSDERGEAELSRVALDALAKDLGDDAHYREESSSSAEGVNDLLPEVRQGIGLLRMRDLDKDMSDRLLALFSAWGALEPPLRAVVLDLSECESGAVSSAITLVNTFAPGQVVLELVAREPSEGTLVRRAFRGDASFRSTGFDQLPVFVQLSSRSGVLAEAAALSLRRQRGARILGTLTAGEGRLVYYERFAWNAWFGFTVADVLASDGTPLRGHPAVPDACVRDGELVPLLERTEAAFREHCGPPGPEVRSEAVLRFVDELIAREGSSPKGGAPGTLKYGEEET
jgi:hypothetical protein